MRKRYSKKGLSPVIATVLLVGIVVIIGLIIFTWFRGLTQEAVVKFDENIQLVCNDVDFEATYSLSSGDLAILNRGNVPIFGLKAKFSKLGDYETRDLSEISNWPASGLAAGGATSVNIGNDVPSGTENIVLTPVLKGTSQKGIEASVTCDENLHGYKINIV